MTLNYCEVGEKLGEKVNKRGEEARGEAPGCGYFHIKQIKFRCSGDNCGVPCGPHTHAQHKNQCTPGNTVRLTSSQCCSGDFASRVERFDFFVTQILLGFFVIIINQSTLGLHVVFVKQLARQLAEQLARSCGLRAAQKKAYSRQKNVGLHSGHLSLMAQHS